MQELRDPRAPGKLAAEARGRRAAGGRWLHRVYRLCLGPTPGVPFDPRWRTETAAALARRAAETREPCTLVILADALEDAGCGGGPLSGHLAAMRWDHTCRTLADWSVWSLLGLGDD
jgi:hypothetical protein